MHPHAIVIEIYVFEYVLTSLLSRLVLTAFHELALQGFEERLGNRVVERRAGLRHRLSILYDSRHFLKRTRHILATLIVMENEILVARWALASL